jgi:sigma-B regulation protein RsbU (phosphoserine phosphatase)
MARTLTHLRAEAARRASVSDILEAVNRLLCEGNAAGMFVTLFCAVLDTDSGMLYHASAGHNPPLVVRPDGTSRFLEVGKGLVAGILESSRYAAGLTVMKPGETLLLYTDGVTEALDPSGELFSESRLVEVLRRLAGRAPGELVKALNDELLAFADGAAQADDITLLALRHDPKRIVLADVPEEALER